nr:unnamed protein product [Spirometra erinaceieuropaei]
MPEPLSGLDLAIGTIALLLQSKFDETENRPGHAQGFHLLKSCTRTHFTFDGIIYEQVKGTPMGSPILGFIAEAVLQLLESLVFQHHKPKFWARLCFIFFHLALIVESYDPICYVNCRLLHTSISGRLSFTTIINRGFRTGFLNENPFSKLASGTDLCTTSMGSFGCRGSTRDGLNTTRFEFENSGNVNYINLRDTFPITIHRINTPIFTPHGAAFNITGSSRLDICPTENQVHVTWDITLARCHGLRLYCFIDEERFFVPPITARQCQRLGERRSAFQIRVGVKRRADERLTFVSCSLDPALQYSQTFIIDWTSKS